MEYRVPADEALVAQAYRLANLPVGPDGIEVMTPIVEGVWALLDGLHDSTLADAPFASAFSAQWREDR